MSNKIKLRRVGRFQIPTDQRRRPIRLLENTTTTAEQVNIQETVWQLTEATSGSDSSTYIIDIIRSGWNTSGSRYYPADVLERDIPQIYGPGTHMYIDHPSRSEQQDRPERSLVNLAAVFVDTPWPVREDDGTVRMRTTVRVFAPWRKMLAEMWPYIGVSINGYGEGKHGEREGHRGFIVEQLTHGDSVDFVTKPGAGGRVIGVLESATTNQQAENVGEHLESQIHLACATLADDLHRQGHLTGDDREVVSSAITEALTVFTRNLDENARHLYQRNLPAPTGEPENEGERKTMREVSAERYQQTLRAALNAAYGQTETGIWVRDYDPDNGIVWFTSYSQGNQNSRTWQQSYRRREDGTIVLTGERIEVYAYTAYAPIQATKVSPVAADPAESSVPTEPSETNKTTNTKENTMSAQTTVSDAASPGTSKTEKQLREALRRAEAAERALREHAAKLARLQAAEKARKIAEAELAKSDLPEVARRRTLETALRNLPLTTDNSLDETQFRSTLEAEIKAEATYIAALRKEAGAGQVTGLGANTMPVSESLKSENLDQQLISLYESRGISREMAEKIIEGRPL